VDLRYHATTAIARCCRFQFLYTKVVARSGRASQILRANQIEVLVFWFLRRSSSRGKRRRHERRVGDARVNAPFQFCCGRHVRKGSALQAMPRRRLRGPPNGPKEVELTEHNSQRLSQDGLGSARSTSAPATI
jgi:hypothetical protein